MNGKAYGECVYANKVVLGSQVVSGSLHCGEGIGMYGSMQIRWRDLVCVHN